jgi:hypothetical protein
VRHKKRKRTLWEDFCAKPVGILLSFIGGTVGNGYPAPAPAAVVHVILCTQLEQGGLERSGVLWLKTPGEAGTRGSCLLNYPSA